MTFTDEAKETISGHLDVVLTNGDGRWPDVPPEVGGDDGDSLAAWSYVTGFANALGLTANQLFRELGLAEHDVQLNCECDDGAHGPHVGFLHMDNSPRGAPGLGWDGQHIECCDSCGTLPDDDAAIELHRHVCGCGWGERPRTWERK